MKLALYLPNFRDKVTVGKGTNLLVGSAAQITDMLKR